MIKKKKKKKRLGTEFGRDVTRMRDGEIGGKQTIRKTTVSLIIWN
jgi:hypothetical protein